jgi:eukaryotic-like serine/threonine-protein kinase
MDDLALDAPDDLRLLAGRYQLCAVMGRGGMGTVWRARDDLLNRDVAVKEVTWPPYLNEAEQRAAGRRALTEAQLAARLQHPNVVGIYDVIEEDGRPWIVMELFQYRSLRDIVRADGPLQPARVARLGLGILAALRAAHAVGIVHRDVKPANILVSPEDRAVLTDFGIARATDSSTLTADLLVGSPSYIAPERAWGGREGPQADLWALGAALYAAVEGRAPFERDDALASLTAAVTDEPEPAIHAGLLWPVISGLLRKDPDSRLGPAEAERMLRQAVRAGEAPPRFSGVPDRGSHDARTPGAGPPRRSRRALGALAATVAMAGAAAAAIALPLSQSAGSSAAGSPASGFAAGPHPSASSPGRGSPVRAASPSGPNPSPSQAAPPAAVVAAISSRPEGKAKGQGLKDGGPPAGHAHAQPGKQRHPHGHGKSG